MAKEICISSTPHETRLAILEDDQLAEIYYERENEYTLAGSIYNGRVTRVLPGMQSAFVDVGLERDAFLYVTDFMELEDPEETDEIEKAAATGGNTPPREVRHQSAPERTQERAPERSAEPAQERGSDRSSERSQDRNQDRGGRSSQGRPGRDRRPAPEAAPEIVEIPQAAPTPSPTIEQFEDAQDEAAGGGGKRWRGRRRRRGGRSGAGSPEGQAEGEESSQVYIEQVPEVEVAPEIHAEAGDRAPQQTWTPPVPAAPAPRYNQPAAPAPFVLPGESLSRYGATPPADEPSSRPEAPARPKSTFKPSTMVEAPFVWDGSGPLPGESLSRHRAPEPEAEPSEESGPGSHGNGDSVDAFEEEAFVVEMIAPDAPHSTDLIAPTEEHNGAPQFEEEELVEEELVEEDPPHEPAPADYTEETVLEQPSAEESIAEPMTRQDEVVDEADHDAPAAPAEAEPDAEASHHIEHPPTGFRLFGLGGKKKKPEDEEPAQPEAKPASVPSVSAYAPGKGVIEEEVIEEEEFEAPRHAHRGKAAAHDNDDFEEETLPAQMRTGDLGELLQEAHLDHRIQLNFDGKNGEDDDDDEDDDAIAVGQPATGGDSSQQRRGDRGGRNRRGGRPGQSAPAGPAQNRGRGPSRRSMQTSDLPIISDLLKPGQEILVQIAKEPIAKKGARITSHIALPGRFLVFMPTVTHIGVSRKIESDEERQRLKRILVHERGEASGGFIVRTAAEGASEEELRADLRFLIHLWNEIKQRSDTSKSPALIYHDLSLIERILRDQVSSNFSNIWVDTEENYERIVRFLNRFSPNLVRRVKLYTKEVPLFEHFGIQDEISKALRSKVWLKSGGSIVINQTEALVAIDINTGKYVGKSARLEDTILKTNLDAVPEIVRQIRLRDLGGIIVIDFIDMDERKNRFRVMAALEEALKSDRAPTKVLQFNDFGLVAITRKRVKQSLERTLSVPCPTCQATGMVKSPTTVCNEIYTELRKMKKHFEGADVLLRVNPETVKVLKANNGSWLVEFEELVGKNILVKSDPTLHPEQFDVQG